MKNLTLLILTLTVVFPLYNNGALYGAIQHGIHNFFIREAGKEDV